MTPLAGVTVLDFSTLLPGPLATLMLAEAGADVIKVERNGGGDEMRSRKPRFGDHSATFAMLNRGKRSIAIDLKDPAAVDRLKPLIEKADVVVEQFRPGVMRRLGLHYEAVQAINPRIIYCSLTGYGQTGERARWPGHDLNYLAESGLLSTVTGKDGTPALPAAPFADIAGGSYPLVINILLALLQRAKTGEGSFIDVAMADSLFPFSCEALARGFIDREWPRADAERLTGGLARYRCYRTRDNRFIAVGALEDKFWQQFCDIIGLPAALRNDREAPETSIEAVAEILAMRDTEQWMRAFAGHDVCCSLVKTIAEAAHDAQNGGRNVMDVILRNGDQILPAVPLPIDRALRRSGEVRPAPALGEANDMLRPLR